MLARIAHHMAQAVDAVALHQPHGAGVEIGPHRLGAVPLLGRASTPPPSRRAPAPRRSARRPPCPRPSRRRGAAAASAAPDDAGARHSARPWRRRRRPYRDGRARRAPCRCACGRGARPRARKCSGNRAGRRNGRCREALDGEDSMSGWRELTLWIDVQNVGIGISHRAGFIAAVRAMLIAEQASFRLR